MGVTQVATWNAHPVKSQDRIANKPTRRNYREQFITELSRTPFLRQPIRLHIHVVVRYV